ncbi:uncharacterized protein DUF1792 [Stackebrandtia endophytica]|uniref:Uncharacterized protein DUF1792 n=1 Tax=Stackebrandtia endophytica TaxID=1496996 RepID=A0A543AZP4_9ACTN|nr:GT-D fold domain-containing glycosyltransferase [Stackebrandtia endophytica]TQL78048.1 uncharacterized protein DUF1792 [Stackebrandtia endophytica]
MSLRSSWRSVMRLRHELSQAVTTLGAIRTEMARRNELDSRSDDLRAIREELRLHRRYYEIARHWMLDSVMREISEVTDRCQLDFAATLHHLIDRRVNFARFGDGEFRLMLRPDHNTRFQVGDPQLRTQLRRVFTLDGYDPDRVLVGFPHPYRKNLHWCGVWMDVWPDLRELMPAEPVLGNSHVTRPIFFQQLREEGVKLWRQVWEGRRVTVVTGEGSRFNLPDELFDNVESIDMLYSLPENAFEDLPRMVDTIGELDTDLVLIALGPAGTVLSAQLSCHDIWAVDVGHISNSWQTIYQDAPMPERLETVRSE